jgi:hypothetical protein
MITHIEFSSLITFIKTHISVINILNIFTKNKNNLVDNTSSFGNLYTKPLFFAK